MGQAGVIDHRPVRTLYATGFDHMPMPQFLQPEGVARRHPVHRRSRSFFVRAGDTLVVTRIDRLARSLKDLQDIVHELKAKEVALKATEQPVDTGTAAGKSFLDMLGVFAEFETNLRRDAAKARGVYKGRKPAIDAGEVWRPRHDEQLGPAAIARRLGIGRASVYRLLGKPAAGATGRGGDADPA